MRYYHLPMIPFYFVQNIVNHALNGCREVLYSINTDHIITHALQTYAKHRKKKTKTKQKKIIVKKCIRGFLTFTSLELSSAPPVLPLLKSGDHQAATLFEIPYKNAWVNELSVQCQKATNALFHDYLFIYKKTYWQFMVRIDAKTPIDNRSNVEWQWAFHNKS
jgi:hypothetical protein